MILTHGANSLKVSSGGAVIGGRTYRTVVMPDGKEWLAENLDYKFEGCTIGSSVSLDSPRGNYYNNDESTYGWNGRKCGLLYNYPATKYLNDNRATLIPGWHVASSSEWDNLSTAIGGNNNAPKLKSVNLPWTSSSWSGTDIYGFTVLPGGARYPTAFDSVGSVCSFATSTPYDSGFAIKQFSTDEYIHSYNLNANVQCYIRLVKDS